MLFLLFATVTSHGQAFAPAVYPQGYFRSPLDIPISLAGNFGELRPNHYHMGFDLRTDHHENMPVHAAADGYIAKVKIEPAGFGRAIYINHPNGFTTVYGHLNAFLPELDAWVQKQQYQQESWNVLLDVPAALFPVKKGDLIAFSGNTGGSQGPHLHFEIRQTDADINCNPMLFGFSLEDRTKPTISRLAVYNRQLSVYEQLPKFIPIKKTADGYGTASPLLELSSPRISFAISAADTYTGSAHPNGIYAASIADNDRPVIGFSMDKISYNTTRNINAHIDYKTRAAGGPFLQQLFELPGYLNSIYTPFSGNGTIDISDGNVHAIKITVKDAYNNVSVLATKVRYTGHQQAMPAFSGQLFYPLMLDGFEAPNCEFYIGEHALYDAVHIAYGQSPAATINRMSDVFTIGHPGIPLQDSILVRIKSPAALDTVQRRHIVMQLTAGSKHAVQKVEWQKDWAAARFRDLGNFQLLLDDTPPVILPVGFKDGANLSGAARLVFIIKDNLEVYKRFRAELDGHWLRFTNDKGKSFIYIFDEHCRPGPHKLKLQVEDEAGNLAVKVFSFTR